MDGAGKTRTVGVVVFPEFFQNEGVDAVLDNLARRAGVTAIATSPYVMAPAEAGRGSREPPIDGGAGKVRLLDRPLWGRRELWVRTAPSFAPDLSLYRGLRYQPAAPDELTAAHGAIVGEAIRAAKARGIKVWLQVQAAIPPGYRVQFGGPQDDDKPRLPDFSLPALRVDNNGSLASPHIAAYGAALLRDLARAYPEVDGFHIDWPEYPPYTLDGAFVDFSAHAEAAARASEEFDFDLMREDAGRLRTKLLGGLDRQALACLSGGDAGFFMAETLAEHAGVIMLCAFKAALAERLVATYRAALDDAGARDKALVLRTFPPPWTTVSGVAFARLAQHCQGFAVKLFTMHWPMMVRMWTDALAAANPALAGDPALANAVAALFDIGGGNRPEWRYPEPDEPHPVGADAQARKITDARAEAGGAPVAAMAHGYGPVDDFAARWRVAWHAAQGHVWVNRYGYLADAKLDAIGAAARETP